MFEPYCFKNKKGFTLIEVIAGLLILGILAVIAIPKYMSLVDEARKMAAQIAIAEVKGRLAQAQAKYMMRHGGLAPNSEILYIYATDNNQFGTNLTNIGEDFHIFFTSTTAPLTIAVDRVQSEMLINTVLGYFNAIGDQN